MGVNLVGAINAEGQEAMEEGGSTTEVADWVIRLNLSSQAFLLYLRMCYVAKGTDPNGVELVLTSAKAQRYANGHGKAALTELLEVQAITQVKGGQNPRYKIQIYSPEVRALIAGHTHVDGKPIVHYG